MEENDYHGLTVAEALLRFVSDYKRNLHSDGGPRSFRVVHGYGSTGRGGHIRKELRQLLEFQKGKGVLKYIASELGDTHPGYTVITPCSSLLTIPREPPWEGLAACHNLNHTIDQGTPTTRAKPSENVVSLDPASLSALDHFNLPVSK